MKVLRLRDIENGGENSISLHSSNFRDMSSWVDKREILDVMAVFVNTGN
jgi:hypothetical protein